MMFILGFISGMLFLTILVFIITYLDDILRYLRIKLAAIGLYQFYCYLRLKSTLKNNTDKERILKSLLKAGYIKQKHFGKLTKR